MFPVKYYIIFSYTKEYFPICTSSYITLAIYLSFLSTKYLGGHTDLIGGAVSFATEELGEKIKYHQILLGSCTVSTYVQHTLIKHLDQNVVHLANYLLL